MSDVFTWQYFAGIGTMLVVNALALAVLVRSDDWLDNFSDDDESEDQQQ